MQTWLSGLDYSRLWVDEYTAFSRSTRFEEKIISWSFDLRGFINDARDFSCKQSDFVDLGTFVDCCWNRRIFTRFEVDIK